MAGTKQGIKDWIHTGKVFVDGLEFERLTHPSFPEYSLRLSTPQSEAFCDKDVKQHSGYLDISDSKHLGSSSSSREASPRMTLSSSGSTAVPVAPLSTGCSLSLVLAVSPMRAARSRTTPTREQQGQLSLPRPAVDVGYSYSDNDQVNNSPAAAEDV